MTERRAQMPGYDEVRRGTQTGGIPLDSIFKVEESRERREEREDAREAERREDRRWMMLLVARMLIVICGMTAVVVVAALDSPGAAAVYGLSALALGFAISGILRTHA